MNKKFKKAIQDTFVSPEAMHRDEFFKNAENLIDAGNKKRRKSIPLIYRLSAAAVFTAAAIGIGIGLNTVKPPKISDFRESEIVTETTAVNNPTTEKVTDKNDVTAVSTTTASVSGGNERTSVVQAPLETSVYTSYSKFSATVTSVSTAAKSTTKGSQNITTTTTNKNSELEKEENMQKRINEILSMFTAAMVTGSLVPGTGNAEQHEIRKFGFQADYPYFEEHELDFDFDSNGKFDYRDLYYLTYKVEYDMDMKIYNNERRKGANEQQILDKYGTLDDLLPPEIREKIEKNADVPYDGEFNGEIDSYDQFSLKHYYYDKYITKQHNLEVFDVNADYPKLTTSDKCGFKEYFIKLFIVDVPFSYDEELYDYAKTNSLFDSIMYNVINVDIDGDGIKSIYDFYDLKRYYNCVYSEQCYQYCLENSIVDYKGIDYDKPLIDTIADETYNKLIRRYAADYLKENKTFFEISGLTEKEWEKAKKVYNEIEDMMFTWFNDDPSDAYKNLLGYFRTFYELKDEMKNVDMYNAYKPTFSIASYLKECDDPDDMNADFVNDLIGAAAYIKIDYIIEADFNTKADIDLSDIETMEKAEEICKKVMNDIESGKMSLPDVNFDGKCNCLDYLFVQMYATSLHYHKTAEESLLPVEVWNYIDTQIDFDNDGVSGDFIDINVISMMSLLYGGGWTEEIDKELSQYYVLLSGQANENEFSAFMANCTADKEDGDVNLDGKITAVDASAVLSYYADSSVEGEINEVTEQRMNLMGDFNSDGTVDSRDASGILSRYAELSVQ